eukprot:3157591-Rhodomonas_salina.4
MKARASHSTRVGRKERSPTFRSLAASSHQPSLEGPEGHVSPSRSYQNTLARRQVHWLQRDEHMHLAERQHSASPPAISALTIAHYTATHTHGSNNKKKKDMPGTKCTEKKDASL